MLVFAGVYSCVCVHTCMCIVVSFKEIGSKYYFREKIIIIKEIKITGSPNLYIQEVFLRST